MIKNFDKYDMDGEPDFDRIQVLGSIDRYDIATINGDTRIFYQGDLIAIVENVDLNQSLDISRNFIER